jgi:hypothetical protein
MLRCNMRRTEPDLGSYCTDPEYSGAGFVVFTDGSFIRGEDSTEDVCGYAAVVCRMEDYLRPGYDFEEGSYIVLAGAAPLAGANYAAEVKALLVALFALPIEAPLLCVSDALSALQVLWKPTVASGARLRAGARSLVGPARALLHLRTNTSCTHVHSHSGKTDILSRGNALADADKAMSSLPLLQVPLPAPLLGKATLKYEDSVPPLRVRGLLTRRKSFWIGCEGKPALTLVPSLIKLHSSKIAASSNLAYEMPYDFEKLFQPKK